MLKTHSIPKQNNNTERILVARHWQPVKWSSISVIYQLWIICVACVYMYIKKYFFPFFSIQCLDKWKTFKWVSEWVRLYVCLSIYSFLFLCLLLLPFIWVFIRYFYCLLPYKKRLKKWFLMTMMMMFISTCIYIHTFLCMLYASRSH